MFRWIEDNVCSQLSNFSNDTCGDQSAKQSTFSPALCPALSVASPTGSPPPAWLPSNEPLEILTTVSGVNFDKLNRTMKAEMKDKFANVFVSAFGVLTEQVTVELTKGSVLVTAAIRPNAGQSLDPTKVPSSVEVVTAVLSVSGIGRAKEHGAEIAASKPLVRRHEQGITTTTTAMTMPATSTSKFANGLEDSSDLVAIMAAVVGLVTVVTCIWTCICGCCRGQRQLPWLVRLIAWRFGAKCLAEGVKVRVWRDVVTSLRCSCWLRRYVQKCQTRDHWVLTAELHADGQCGACAGLTSAAGTPRPRARPDPKIILGRGSDEKSSSSCLQPSPFDAPCLPPV